MRQGAQLLVGLVGVLWLSRPTLQAQSTTQQIVDRFYLLDRLEPNDASDRRSCFAVLETAASGEPSLIVAAYTDINSGAALVIGPTAEGGYGVAYTLPASYPRLPIESTMSVALTGAPGATLTFTLSDSTAR
jgi:hypothetical protein